MTVQAGYERNTAEPTVRLTDVRLLVSVGGAPQLAQESVRAPQAGSGKEGHSGCAEFYGLCRGSHLCDR